MFIELLTFLTEHKVVVLGAAATLSEVVVILVNMWRKIKKNRLEISVLGENEPKPRITSKDFLWSVNPINLFRRP